MMRLPCQPLVLIFQLLKIFKKKTFACPLGLNPGSIPTCN